MKPTRAKPNSKRVVLPGLIFLFIAIASILFIGAGTALYIEAWVYLAAFFAPVLGSTLYLLKKDTGLLLRRMGVGFIKEKETKQKIIQFIAQLAFVAVFLVPALDRRFLWSSVPFEVSLIADLFVLLGFYIVFLTFKANTFTSTSIAVGFGPQVISTGPYIYVRHPMYIGALLMLLATPIALGSLWGLLVFIPMLIVIVRHLMEEERFLSRNLKGYSEYTTKVRFKLLPGIF